MNTLYYGDNLKILREYIADETVDLVYLDPPFNSNRNYNVLFKDESGAEAEAQITAFEDTWHWNAAAETTYHELVLAGDDVSKMVEAFRSFIGTNQMMAYLTMMAVRLKELHRVLKETGSLYLHCDPTASHYLKILLDTIFGGENYKNEIVWQRTNSHNTAGQFGRIHDIILFYVKSKNYTWNIVTTEFSKAQLSRYEEDEDGRLYTGQDLTAPRPDSNSGKFEWRGTMPSPSRGWGYELEQLEDWWEKGLILTKRDGTPRMDGLKVYLDEKEGKRLQSVWTDVPRISNTSAERLGYPTQKPVALLERIIQASSNEGDTVLDPFCGCGTTIAAAQKLNRNWIGIDITHLSIALQKYRLKDTFGLEPKGKSAKSTGGNATVKERVINAEENTLPDGRVSAYLIIGEPEDLQSAEQLASEDRYQFQWWALSLIKARPLGAASSNSKVGKKGADKGIDGIIPFIDDRSGKAKRVLVQVKSGKVKSGDIRDLRGTVERENAALGVFITLENPSRDMTTEAVSAGFYRSEYFHRDYPKIQILTIEDLFNGKQVEMPSDSIAFKQAEKFTKNTDQGALF